MVPLAKRPSSSPNGDLRFSKGAWAALDDKPVREGLGGGRIGAPGPQTEIGSCGYRAGYGARHIPSRPRPSSRIRPCRHPASTM